MSELETRTDANRGSQAKEAPKANLPPWMMAEKTSGWEKAEILVYKLISIFPVFVTFGLYTFLFTFYLGVYFKFLSTKNLL
jgi:hypothetical protein